MLHGEERMEACSSKVTSKGQVVIPKGLTGEICNTSGYENPLDSS